MTVQKQENSLEFYYTGAKSFEGDQLGPSESLGGFASNIAVPNEQLFNLWSDLAVLSTEAFNVKAIVLKNVSKNALESLRFWCENYRHESFFWVEIGVVHLNEGQMQIINSPYSTPRGVDFQKYYLLPTSKKTGEVIPENEVVDWEKIHSDDEVLYDPDNSYNVDNVFKFPESFGPEALFGFWVKRVIDYDKLREAFKCSNLYDDYKRQLREKFGLADGDDKQRAIDACSLIFNNSERKKCLADAEKKYGSCDIDSLSTKDLAPMAGSILGDTGIEIAFDYLYEDGVGGGLFLKVTEDSSLITVTP